MYPVIETERIPSPISYADMLARQHERQRAVEQGIAPNTLFLLQHTPVVTLGRAAHAENLLLSREEYARRGIEIVQTDRGGDVTCHGPGQLVAYPILNLTQWQCSVGWYLRSLEEVIIRVLAHYGFEGERLPGHTGVWVAGAKIAAIGVGIHHWVTCHGLAFNVDPDMTHFQYIIPCGIIDKPVTSLRQLLGHPPGLTQAATHVESEFRVVFQRRSSWAKGVNGRGE
jgi:lipoate-protein ligase B